MSSVQPPVNPPVQPSASSRARRADGAIVRDRRLRHSKLDPERRGSILVTRGGREYRYSMASIAAGAGLSRSEVCRVMNGQRTGRLQTLNKIAAFLKLPFAALNAYLTTQRPKHKR